MLLADLCRMCENCRFYNGEGTTYWDCAMRLENYAKNKLNAIAVRRPRRRRRRRVQSPPSYFRLG